VLALPAQTDLYAIAYDGFVTIDGKRYDAVIVEATERNLGKAYVMAQRYKPSAKNQPLQTIGNPAFLNRAESLFHR